MESIVNMLFESIKLMFTSKWVVRYIWDYDLIDLCIRLIAF